MMSARAEEPCGTSDSQRASYETSASSWRYVRKDTAVDCPAYLFEVEEHRNDSGDQMLFIHLRVRRWSASTLREMRRVFALFRAVVRQPLFCTTSEQDDDKFTRWCALFGFQFLQNVICENGQERRLFVHYNKEEKDGLSSEQFSKQKHRPKD